MNPVAVCNAGPDLFFRMVFSYYGYSKNDTEKTFEKR